jgi:hypothetical protein
MFWDIVGALMFISIGIPIITMIGFILVGLIGGIIKR